MRRKKSTKRGKARRLDAANAQAAKKTRADVFGVSCANLRTI